jgi:hypothetical protein
MWPSHIATFSWMPWVVLAVELAWREGGRKIFLAAFVGALQMLAGGPEIIFLTWLLLLALWILQFVKRRIFTLLNALAFSAGCRAGDRAGGGATAAVPRPRRPFAARIRLRRHCAGPCPAGAGQIFSCRWLSATPGTKESFFSTANTGHRRIISASARSGWRCWRFGRSGNGACGCSADCDAVALIFALGENTPVLSRPAKNHPAVELDHLSGQICDPSSASLAPLLAAFALANLRTLRSV